MSYCVNCGVELAESEKFCPLCQTEVINPNAPWKDPQVRPYPPVMDTLIARIDRQYLAALISTFLLIPVIVVLLADWLDDGPSWSLYVMGAAALLEIWFILPLMTKRYHLMTFLALDAVAAIMYLLLIERLSGGAWFLRLALPISVGAAMCLLITAFLFRCKKGQDFIIRLVILLAGAGLMAVLVEISIDMFRDGAIYLNWSLFVLSPCLIVIASLLIINGKRSLKEEIHRRIFY